MNESQTSQLNPSLTSSEENDEWEWEVACGFDPPHTHSYPSDWQWGGPDRLDPRADPRYQPDTYVYFGSDLRPLHVTQVPLCDDEAIDYFTAVAGFGHGYNPKWLQVTRAGERDPITLPVEYNIETDEVYEKATL